MKGPFAIVMPSNQAETSRGPYRFAVATSCCTILLLMAGALVTSNDAADSVPDWPLAYGKLIPPLIGGIRFEYTHRVIAATVAIMTLILAVWLSFAKVRPLAKACVIRRPVGHLSLLPRDMVATCGVGLERHGGIPDPNRGCRRPIPAAPTAPTADPCNNAS